VVRGVALLAVFFLLPFPLWAAPPQAVDAGYRLTRMGQPFGTAQETFRREGGQYRIESVTSAAGVFALFAKGKVRLLSQGEVTAQGLRPLHFEHHRGDDPGKRIVADFDWEKRILVHQHDGKRESVELPPGTQDRISLLYQFMFQPPGGAGVELVMSNGRQVGRYLYKVVGEETLSTPAGTFETMHLSKYQDGRRDGTEVWLAKGQHYFPVRIVLDEKDGATLEQELTSLKFGE
jgi:hypothetical protein